MRNDVFAYLILHKWVWLCLLRRKNNVTIIAIKYSFIINKIIDFHSFSLYLFYNLNNYIVICTNKLHFNNLITITFRLQQLLIKFKIHNEKFIISLLINNLSRILSILLNNIFMTKQINIYFHFTIIQLSEQEIWL